MQVRSLSQEDALEEGMTTHSSILAWRIPWTEEPGGLQSMASQRVRHDQATSHTCSAGSSDGQLMNDNPQKLQQSVKIYSSLG